MKGYALGDSIELAGVITHSRPGRGGVEYTIHTGEQKVSFFSQENMPKGSELAISAKITGLLPMQISVQAVQQQKGIYEQVAKKIEEKVQLGGFLLANPVTEQLAEQFKAVARRLHSAKELNRNVLLRFHGDADGIAGALALGEVAFFKPLQQNSAVYSQRESVGDLSYLYHEEKPLVILLDFGSNAKSAKQLEILRASGAELILIDHHPLEMEAKPIPHLVLSPWLATVENPSSYTAGYLAAEIAHLLGADSAKYAKIACAGDKSHVYEPGDEDKKSALVLDYLAANISYGNNLSFYKNVLEKQELFSSIYLQARENIDAAAEKAMVKMKKREKGELQIFIVPLAGIINRGEFPNSSKITTAILERVKSDKPTIIIGYRSSTLILRASKDCVARGINFADIIQRLSNKFVGVIRTGGGHATAAAIHVHKDYEQTVIDALIEEIK
ncbi:MAG: hypothetical protein V1492_06015 [Candidatus Micrarchaeota archaeon]